MQHPRTANDDQVAGRPVFSASPFARIQRTARLTLLFVIAILGCGAAIPALVHAAGWPSHRHDPARSGVTDEKLALPLRAAWTFRSKYPPQPAWPGPARRDGWHKVDNLKPRVIFDWAFHVVAGNGAVYFGSSADDKVYSLDAATGRERWSFFTEAPVRLAPTIANDRLYVGSDDGMVYCVNLADGSLVWKYKAAPSDVRVPGNGRMMSLWPVRTGVLVDNNVAYFAAGLFAFEGAYLCALNADSGSELWKKRLENITPQGYLLASDSRLYVPTGRGAPVVFERETGKYLHALGGSGGAFCVLADDALIYGPGNTGSLDVFGAASKDHLATFAGNQIVVTPGMSYLHTDTELSALDRARYLGLMAQRRRMVRQQQGLRKRLKKSDEETPEAKADIQKEIAALQKSLGEIDRELPTCFAWKRACKHPYALILAGDTLFAGGTNHVAAFAASDGTTRWSAPVEGRALDLAVADGRLIVSTDRGIIYGFASGQ